MVNRTVSGIQRSALNIIENAILRRDGRPVYGLVKHPLTGKFRVADLSFMSEPYDLSDFASRFELLSGKSRWFSRKLRKYRRRPLGRLFCYCRLHAKWATSRRLRTEVLSLSEVSRPSCLVEAGLANGGIIISLGAGFGTDYVGVSELARKHDCKVVSFIHDIFPVTTPEYTAFSKEGKNLDFKNWLYHIAKESQLMLCNSHFTKKQIEQYLSPAGAFRNVGVMPFAHEFVPAMSDLSIRNDIVTLMRMDFVLCVGTIEIRKNIIGLLRAWKELQTIRRGDTPALVISGKRGWGVKEIYDFLRDTNHLDGTVKIIDRPNDTELDLLYRHCRFTVFPSLMEGWGLPIGESLWYRKPVLCACSASMPEAGGEFATYFSHAEPQSLFAQLLDMIENPEHLPNNIRDYLRTWEDTANSLFEAIDARMAAEPSQSHYWLGSKVPAA
jgi:glycosyltransferase involved in cell wall biosynthesis